MVHTIFIHANIVLAKKLFIGFKHKVSYVFMKFPSYLENPYL